MNSIFRTAISYPVVKDVTERRSTVLKDAIPYGLKTVPEFICSKANVQIPVCVKATEYLFTTH